jgi:hypothetical protein
MSVEQISVGLSLGTRVCFDPRPMQPYGAVCQDREVIDMALVDMGDHNLVLQNLGSGFRASGHSAFDVRKLRLTQEHAFRSIGKASLKPSLTDLTCATAGLNLTGA